MELAHHILYYLQTNRNDDEPLVFMGIDGELYGICGGGRLYANLNSGGGT